MGFVKNVEHAKRYKDLAWLLVKYGKSDLVKQLDLENPEVEPTTIPKSKAEDLPNDLEKLGTTYIKLGQFLSTRPDFLPPAYIDSLSRLQDKVAPVPEEEIEEIITQELGVRISKAFESFEKEPMASASIGQVHFARLKGGRPVAVKIQRPNIRKKIFKDLDAFDEIAGFLENNTDLGKQLMLQATLEEFRKVILHELDYRQEAQNLITISQNLKEFKKITVPVPVEDYTTSRVLTMDYIRGKNVNKLSPIGQLEINGKELAEVLFKAYLKQVLIDGFYHADPHPGNIFITDTYELALLDLGMVARVSEKMQAKLIRMLLAISEGNGEKAADYALAMGEKEQQANQTIFAQQVSEIVAQTYDNALKQIQVGRLVLEITKISRKNGILLPNELVMLGKTLLNLDRVGRTLDPDFDPNASLRKNAAELMQKRMLESFSPGNFYEVLLDAKNFIEHFPERTNKIMQALAENRFTIQAKMVDEKYFINGLKEAANRLTIGLVLAALIIGAALLMRVETSFTIMGYPGIAIILFLLAALGGFILVFRSMFKDRNDKT
ncbi:MAG TPA: AarF/UbiB family protein [Prolixibacteraceae bacterium]|nr:AarF/UbiB family protein [Prolixibacteraceae bacterium]